MVATLKKIIRLKSAIWPCEFMKHILTPISEKGDLQTTLAQITFIKLTPVKRLSFVGINAGFSFEF